jgi:hypothetical protein
MRCNSSRLSQILVHGFLGLFLSAANAQNPLEPGSTCGAPTNSYGPFDYRSANQQQRSIVENAHFTRGVENLIGGGSGHIGKDIAYTLAVFPNHPRALISMDRLAAKEGRDPPNQVRLTVECWYERAIRWRGNDLVVRMLFADYLIRNNRTPQAVSQLDFVSERAGDNPFTHHNAGLLFADAKVWDKALRQAHQAMALGFPRTDLRDRLQAAGQWREPVPESAAEPAASAASPASAASAASQP